MKPSLVELRHHAAVTGRPGEERVAVSVGSDGNVIALWAPAEAVSALTSSTTQPGWAVFPDARSSRPVAARVSVHTPKRATVAELRELDLAHVTLQPLSQGRTLVVGARCRWRSDAPERNARVYDSAGEIVAEATLGDGIEHVFTTPSDHVWVGYFDEGVYGNYGWGETGSPAPVGRHGLVRFTPELGPGWQFPYEAGPSAGAISDCYALNVHGEQAWACYYTDFPVVRVRDGAVSAWRNTVSGARALITDGFRVALAGGYRDEHDRLAVGTVGDEALHVTGTYRLVLPGGGQLPPSAQQFGRGPDLHVLAGGDWYRLGLEDVPGT